MYKIIGGDGREYGPVTAEQITGWIVQNRANGDTKARRESDADWLPLSQFPEFAEAFAGRAAPPPIPAAPATSPALASATGDQPDPAEAARACAGRSYRLSVFECLERGWAILSSRFWLTVGGSAVALLASAAAGSIPLAGILVSLLLPQVFNGGVFWLMLRVSRNEDAEFADSFGGFSLAFGRLVLLSLYMALVNLVLVAIALGPLFVVFIKHGLLKHQEPDMAALLPELLGPAAWAGLMMLPIMYLQISWIFAPLLVIDRGLDAWESMELSRKVAGRRWFRLFFLHLAFFPLVIAGLLCLIVGVFVVLAFYYAAYTAAYEAAFAEKPSPDGSSFPRPQ